MNDSCELVLKFHFIITQFILLSLHIRDVIIQNIRTTITLHIRSRYCHSGIDRKRLANIVLVFYIIDTDLVAQSEQILCHWQVFQFSIHSTTKSSWHLLLRDGSHLLRHFNVIHHWAHEPRWRNRGTFPCLFWTHFFQYYELNPPSACTVMMMICFTATWFFFGWGRPLFFLLDHVRCRLGLGRLSGVIQFGTPPHEIRLCAF